MNAAILSLSALAHDTRIDIFRLLTKAAPEGISAGDISAALQIKPNTLSNNLNILSAAGLVRSAREGRSVRYFVRMDGMRGLLAFLMEDCCGGDSGLCQKFLDQVPGSLLCTDNGKLEMKQKGRHVARHT